MTNKRKRSFFQAVVVSILLYRCTTWTLTTQECSDQYWTSPGGNTPQSSSYTATFHPSRKLLDEPDIRDIAGEVVTIDVLLWVLLHGRAKAGRTAQTYIQKLYEDTGCSPEDLPEAMNDGEGWRKRVRHDKMMMMMMMMTYWSVSLTIQLNITHFLNTVEWLNSYISVTVKSWTVDFVSYQTVTLSIVLESSNTLL